MSGTRQAISLSFFLSFFLSWYIFFKSFLVLWFFSLSVDKQNSHTFLIFFWWHFNLPMWVGLGKTDYSSPNRHVWLLWGLLSGFNSFWIRPSRCLVLRGPIGQSASSLQISRLLLGAACQFTLILGKLDRQSVSTQPWPEFNSSDFSSTSAGLWGKQKRRERERKRERIYIYE